MGEAVDILLAGIAVFVTIVVVRRGISRGDPSREIRARAGIPALMIVVGLRGLFPVNSWRVSAGYIGTVVVVGVVALWRGPRSRER